MLLGDHLDVTGALAGHRSDATDLFRRGVSCFIATVQDVALVQEVHDGAGSAVRYDATMPAAVVRFAEFFVIRDGRGVTLNLLYDETANSHLRPLILKCQ